jgi:NADH-quinone oxidoreductase subunit L
MMVPLYVLAVPTLLLGLLLVSPPVLLDHVHVDLITSVTGTLLSLTGLAWALGPPTFGRTDAALAIGARPRALLLEGYRMDAAQHTLVVRPVIALAAVVRRGDRDVVDAYVRAVAPTMAAGGNLLRRAQTGLATAYAAWLVLGAVVIAIASLVLA